MASRTEKLDNLEALLKHELKDLYSAEDQIIRALPKMMEKASDRELKQALQDHLEETKEQKRRLEEACRKLDIAPEGVRCKAVEGIISEAEDFLKENAGAEVMDAGIIANAQRVEHYEISGYGTASHFAKRLGMTEVHALLSETLAEEKEADERLNDLAVEKIDQEAM